MVVPYVLWDGLRPDDDGSTPLHWAVLRKHPKAVIILLEAGAEVNSPNARRRTLLHIAAMQEVPGIVQLLLDHGADPWAKNNLEFTPLQIAMNIRNYDLAEILEQAMLAKKPGSEAEIERLKRPPSLDEIFEEFREAGVEISEEDIKQFKENVGIH